LTKRHIAIVYCISIFVASWVLQLAGIHAVRGDLENGGITPWLTVAMITPALGVLPLMAFCRPVREQVLWNPLSLAKTSARPQTRPFLMEMARI
jgi:hypothetical protein